MSDNVTTTVPQRWRSSGVRPDRPAKGSPRRSPAPPTVSAAEADRLVASHLPLVGYLVNEMTLRLSSLVTREDLNAAGLVGLVQAAAAYDPTGEIPFRRYAAARIRQAMSEEVARLSHGERRPTRRDTARDDLPKVLGRAPSTREIAEFLGCTVAELDGSGEDAERAVVWSQVGLDPVAGAATGTPPGAAGVEAAGTSAGYLIDAVGDLPEQLRTVVEMYFLQGRPLSDIATRLRLTETRIAQLRGEALLRLRDGMNGQPDGGGPAEPPPSGPSSRLLGRGSRPAGGTSSTVAPAPTRPPAGDRPGGVADEVRSDGSRVDGSFGGGSSSDGTHGGGRRGVRSHGDSTVDSVTPGMTATRVSALAAMAETMALAAQREAGDSAPSARSADEIGRAGIA